MDAVLRIEIEIKSFFFKVPVLLQLNETIIWLR